MFLKALIKETLLDVCLFVLMMSLYCRLQFRGFPNQNKSSAMLLRSMVFLIFNSIHPMKEL
ncbi:hypothetical protein Hanom_Chr02g00142371 [Helianthus anomalus]